MSGKGLEQILIYDSDFNMRKIFYEESKTKTEKKKEDKNEEKILDK